MTPWEATIKGTSHLSASLSREITVETETIEGAGILPPSQMQRQRLLETSAMTGSATLGVDNLDVLEWQASDLYIISKKALYRYRWEPEVEVMTIRGKGYRGLSRTSDFRVVTKEDARLVSDGASTGEVLNALGILGQIGPVAVGGSKAFYATGTGELITGVQARELSPLGPGSMLWSSTALSHVGSLVFSELSQRLFVATAQSGGPRHLLSVDAATGEVLESYRVGYDRQVKSLATNYESQVFGILDGALHAWSKDLELLWTSIDQNWQALASFGRGLYAAAVVNDSDIWVQEIGKDGQLKASITIPTESGARVEHVATSPGYVYLSYSTSQGCRTRKYKVDRLTLGPLSVVNTEPLECEPLHTVSGAGSFGASVSDWEAFTTLL